MENDCLRNGSDTTLPLHRLIFSRQILDRHTLAIILLTLIRSQILAICIKARPLSAFRHDTVDDIKQGGLADILVYDVSIVFNRIEAEAHV